MGWTGGDDPLSYIDLSFPSLEAAVAYARRQGICFTIHRDHVSSRPSVLNNRGPRCFHPGNVPADRSFSAEEKRDVLHHSALFSGLVQPGLAKNQSALRHNKEAVAGDSQRAPLNTDARHFYAAKRTKNTVRCYESREAARSPPQARLLKAKDAPPAGWRRFN